MAKKKTQVKSAEKRDLVKFCAFWGLVIAALLFIVTGILSFFNGNGNLSTVISVCDVLAKVALLIAIGIPGYGYVRGRSVTWKVIYWVALIIYAAGVVFGFIRWN